MLNGGKSANHLDDLLCNSDIEQESKGSFVGTEDYVAPEIITNEEPSFASDLWSLGVIVYQLFTGKTPFKGDTPFYTFENILACDYQIPSCVPPQAAHLIKALLIIDPSQRLGAGTHKNDIETLKAHPFFEGINFATLHLQIAPVDTRNVIQSPMKR
jgi:serine/threonine protein kinase